ncbi:MAG TPA: agmatine deiminase family protein [Saprospiraceae bacterium]|nr:agmatine deiminase family protein [Saprospiraceae bacterium]HMQ83541.1 agmatine deiminase family protein [Saprospiraceae bacterium]
MNTKTHLFKDVICSSIGYAIHLILFTKKGLAIWLILLFFNACHSTLNTRISNPVARQPAEYDPLSAVWLIWPPNDHLDGYSNEAVTIQIIAALIPHNKVILTTANKDLYIKARKNIPDSLLKSGLLEIKILPSEEFWVRDMGPNFVELENGQPAVVDFNFNAWGYTPIGEMDAYTRRLERYDEQIAHWIGLPLISSNMISEGGNREVNGEGVLVLSEKVEQGRNPTMSLKDMESEFKRLLGIKKVIWLKEGLHEDDHTFRGPLVLKDGSPAFTVITTNGHIDEYARFVNDSTLLLAEVDAADLDDPIAQENHRRMEENYAILKKATDQDGRPFHIIRVPLPQTILGKMKPGDAVYAYISSLDYEGGFQFPQGREVQVIAAASYLNFLIANEVVLAQKFWRPGLDDAVKARDEKVRSILETVFPDRRIIMIDALAVNFGGGGIHCITMQQPQL